ncbi:IgLON family member 5 [Fasciola hepatica]|uniref:IgLON family member 5 n=1 Tax=Fasciola hepatica TaxID=6192 RepID=A0A4E0RBU5_FASHE|nr:IgLON family member 5 [Fasciola hepatica]
MWLECLHLKRRYWTYHVLLPWLITVIFSTPPMFSEGIFVSTKDVVSVVNGTEAKLECQSKVDLQIEDLDNVTWVRSPRQILTRGIFRVTEDTRISTAPLVLLKRRDFSLFIRPVFFEDRGEYRCTITFRDRVYIRTVELRVLVPPKIIRSPVPFLKVDEGASLEMDCLATGHPTPETTWLVQTPRQTTVENNWHESAQTVMEAFAKFGGRIINLKGTLKISRLHRNMNQRLVCVASNGVEPNDRRTVELSVRFPPNVRMANRIIKQIVGKNTMLSCYVTANPSGTIHWFFNHQVKIEASSCDILANEEKKYCLQEHRPPTTDVLSPITSKLTIFRLNHMDFGDYICSVTTIMGEAYGTTTLQAFEDPFQFDSSMMNPPPSMTSSPHDRNKPQTESGKIFPTAKERLFEPRLYLTPVTKSLSLRRKQKQSSSASRKHFISPWWIMFTTIPTVYIILH